MAEERRQVKPGLCTQTLAHRNRVVRALAELENILEDVAAQREMDMKEGHTDGNLELGRVQGLRMAIDTVREHCELGKPS